MMNFDCNLACNNENVSIPVIVVIDINLVFFRAPNIAWSKDVKVTKFKCCHVSRGLKSSMSCLSTNWHDKFIPIL